jgi:hypothetical protein
LAGIFDDLVALPDLQVPEPLLLIPSCRGNLGIIDHIPIEMVFLRYLCEIRLDFASRGVKCWPFCIWNTKKGVDVGWNIAHHTGISILEP